MAFNNSVLSTMWDYISNSLGRRESVDKSDQEVVGKDFLPKMDESSPWGLYSSFPPHHLEKNHTMSEQQKSWFCVENPSQDFQQSQCFPHALSPVKSQPSQTQIAYNITNNSFESLPVTLENPFFNSISMGTSFHMVNMVQGPPQFFENVIEIVEDQLVQFVCHQSSTVSPHRLAAETLARSKLNPNAKEFTPRECDISPVIHPDICDNPKSINDSENKDALNPTLNCDNPIGDPNNPVPDDSVDSDEDDDSDWWDSEDDESSPCCIEIDNSEFEDLFPTALLVSNLVTHCETEPKSAEGNYVEKPASLSVERTHDKSKAKSGGKDVKKCVRFCDFAMNEVIEEPEEIAADLARARSGDYQQRMADRERMERLIAPILTKQHRDKVWEKRRAIEENLSL